MGLWRPDYGWIVVATLCVTETVSWGILYYGFPVLLRPMETDLGFSRVEVTGAFSIGMGVAALAALPVGRWIDRHGARALMTLGSCLGTALLVVWSQVESLAALYTAGAEVSPALGVDGETPLIRLQRREELASLWNEILLLPLPQRSALLLNLRGGGSGSAIALLVLLGVTTFDALAAALAMTGEELAAIWRELPMDDLTIAGRLGVTRQQVINFRQSARKRLDRRRGSDQ